MDLKELDTVKAATDGFEVQLYHPGTNEDLGIFITVLGRDSEEFTKLQSQQNQRRSGKMFKSGQFKPGSLTDEEVKRDTIALLAACTKSWREAPPAKKENGVGAAAAEKVAEKSTLTIAGAELPCTRDNAVQLYTDHPWIREQIDAAVSDRALLFKKP